MRSLPRASVVCLLSAVFPTGSPAAAQDAAPATVPWELSVTPYLWATALKGDAGVGGVSADVDASFSDVLDNLNGALMLEAELRKGRGDLCAQLAVELDLDRCWRRARRCCLIGKCRTGRHICRVRHKILHEEATRPDELVALVWLDRRDFGGRARGE